MASYLQTTDGTRRKAITTSVLADMRKKDDKIAMLTCYDVNARSQY